MATGQASDRRAAVPLTVTHLSRDERIARGRAARKATPRSRHAELDVSSRPDPVALLEAQAKLKPADSGQPTSRQVAFAERLARIKRRAVPDECFRDRQLLSRWIDSNR